MNRTDYNNMTNSELKICLEQTENEYENKKNEVKRLVDELEKLKLKYNNINNELNSRKNIFA